MNPDTSDSTSDELVPIAYFPNSAEAGMACELLRNNGIDATLGGAGFGALEPLRLPGGFSEIRLLVPAHEEERAKALYEAFFAGTAEALTEGQDPPANQDAGHE